MKIRTQSAIFWTVVALALAVLSGTASAGGFEFSESVDFAPSAGYMKNISEEGGPKVAGGMFIGTLLEKRVGENKQVGILGFVVMVATPVAEGLDASASVAGCPVTFFNDRIQPCYGWNFSDETWMLYMGVGATF